MIDFLTQINIIVFEVFCSNSAVVSETFVLDLPSELWALFEGEFDI